MLIQAIFLSLGIEKSCAGCLYKLLFCIGRRKIMCWMLIQAIFFIVRRRKIMCWKLIQAALFFSGVEKAFVENLYKPFFSPWASKNHVLDAYTSCLFFVVCGKIICWMLIQGTFLSSGVEKYCVGGLYERLFCCRALEIMCERLIQAAFLSSGIEKSCVGCLYKRLFCRRASGNHLSKAYASCFFVVGR